MEEDTKSRNRSNPLPKPKEIDLHVKVIADPETKTLSIVGFSADPADELTIAEIGQILGQNPVAYIISMTKSPANIKGKIGKI